MIARVIPVALGFVGIALALGLGTFNGRFLPWHHAMGGLSVLSIIGGMLWINDTRWRELLASLVYTCFFVLSVMLVYLISANRQMRFDLTRNRIHTLSPLTDAVLRRIPADERITIQAFVPSSEEQQFEAFLDSYRKLAPQIQYEIFDAARDLNAVQQMGGDLKNGDLVASRWSATGTLLRKEAGTIKVGSERRENDLTNTIARLVSTQQRTVYFSTGHGERRFDDKPDALTKAATLLRDKGIPLNQLRLMQGVVPEDAAAIVIAGPTVDLFDFEREMLEQYLENGGKLMLMLDPTLSSDGQLGNFEALLERLCVRAPSHFIVDPAGVNMMGLTMTPMVGFSTHPITDGTRKRPFLMNAARPISAIEPIPATMRQAGLLFTSDQVWSEPFDDIRSARRLTPPPDPAAIHAVYTGIAIEQVTRGGREGDFMRAVVLGDSDAFTNEWIEKNGDAAALFLQSIEWLRVQDDLLQVPPRFLETTPVVLTPQRLWLIIGGFFLLGMFITIGGTAWTITRRRMR